MTTLEEWQTKFDSDFPLGAFFYRTDWNDKRDDTPEFRRTTGLHLISIQDGFPQILIMDADNDEYGWTLKVLSYTENLDDKMFTLKTTDMGTWKVYGGVPDKVTGASAWKAQRKAERKYAQEMGTS